MIYPLTFTLNGSLGPFNAPGDFAWSKNLLESKEINSSSLLFETCRETLTLKFFRTDRENYLAYPPNFIFVNGEGNGENVARFILEVERRLKLDKFSTIHGFTNNSRISLVELNPWWVENQLRFQLFTILLRCGIYYRDDFEYGLTQNLYARHTKAAIYKFLEGFTKWGSAESGRSYEELEKDFFSKKLLTWKTGWYSYFKDGLNLELLVKP